jgi:signal transduction histidine kinase
MRLRTKFSLVLSACILMYFFFTTFVLSRLFVTEQKAYLNDFQSTLSLFSKRTLEMRMSLLYSQLEVFVEDPNFRVADLLPRIRGGMGAELWKHNRLIGTINEAERHFLPPVGNTPWALIKSTLPSTTPAIRWLGRYGEKTLVIDFKPEWLDGVLESTHGAFSQIVLPDALILQQSNGSEEARNRTFHSPETLVKMFAGHRGIPKTIQYKSTQGIPYVGTFLAMPTEPPLMITVLTPWSTIQQVVDGMYGRSARLAGIFLFLSLLIGVAFSSTLTSSLGELAEQTLRVARGNFEHPVNVAIKRRDEVGILARSFDTMITELERLRNDLRRSERLAAMGKFSAAVTHELKNPLTNILANEQVIEMKLANANMDRVGIERALKFIKDEGFRATNIVTNLMKFARQEKAPTTTMEVSSALRHSLSILRPAIEQAGVKIVEDIPQTTMYCTADQDQIHEVIANLVGNAAHAVRDCPEKTITVSVEAIADQVILRIQDTGTGITADAKDHIFEPFFTTKKIGEGTGLGLSVCHGIITTHRGKIEVDSEVGAGTCFTITLPRISSAAKAA